MRLGLGEDRDEDVAAVDLLLAAALDVGDGPLQDAVEGDGLGRFGRAGRRQLRDLGGEVLLKLFLEGVG